LEFDRGHIQDTTGYVHVRHCAGLCGIAFTLYEELNYAMILSENHKTKEPAPN